MYSVDEIVYCKSVYIIYWKYEQNSIRCSVKGSLRDISSLNTLPIDDER